MLVKGQVFIPLANWPKSTNILRFEWDLKKSKYFAVKIAIILLFSLYHIFFFSEYAKKEHLKNKFFWLVMREVNFFGHSLVCELCSLKKSTVLFSKMVVETSMPS